MAEPRSFLDIIRDLNIGPTGLKPSAYSRVGSPEEAREAQTALENRPAPTTVTLPDIGRGKIQAARMASSDPAVQSMSASLAPVPQTVADSVSNNLIKALNTGSSNGNKITEAQLKAETATTLMGGDLQAFMQNLLAKQNTAPPKGDFVSNILRMFAQPEFQQAGFEGQGFGPTVLGATNALRAMDTQDAEIMKAQMESLASAEAAGPIWGDAKSFQVEKFDNLQRAIKSADTIQNMKKLLSEGFVSGGVPTAVGFLRGLGNLVNISLNPSNLEEYTTQTNQLATDLVASGIFGKEVNKSEWELIFELIAKPGATKGPPELIEKLNSLLIRINDNIQSDSRVLEAMGVPIKPLLSSRQSLVSERNVGKGN